MFSPVGELIEHKKAKQGFFLEEKDNRGLFRSY